MSSAYLRELYLGLHKARGARLARELAAAVPKLLRATKGETPYAVALYTSGESEFSYVALSANTEEGLDRATRRYLAKDPGADPAKLRATLRWSAPDWDHHLFSKLGGLKFPMLMRSRAEDDVIYELMTQALRKLDAKRLLGTGRARAAVSLHILCGDMGSRFFLRGTRALNPPAVVKRVAREWKAAAPAPSPPSDRPVAGSRRG